jgi:FKBP-type peptidyl-prolyl cis-trans isomerase 2
MGPGLVVWHRYGSRTPQNVRAVTKPKAIEEIPEVGQNLVYDDGRPGHINSRAEILEVASRSMLVQFENHAAQP